MATRAAPSDRTDTENPEERVKTIVLSSQPTSRPSSSLNDQTNGAPSVSSSATTQPLASPSPVVPASPSSSAPHPADDDDDDDDDDYDDDGMEEIRNIPAQLRRGREADTNPPEDIDKEDKDDPVFCADQAQDIHDNMRMEEVVTQVDPGYFVNTQTDVTAKMRMIVIDWLAQIATRSRMAPETLFLSVWLIDKYLSKRAIKRDSFQLVGITALFIANKMEEVNATDIKDLADCCDIGASCDQDMINMEPDMLACVDWKLMSPTPLLFLRRYSKASDADSFHHTVSKFIIELGLGYSEMLDFLPSVRAAAAVYLARFFLDDKELWPHEVEYYSGYKEADILPCAKVIYKFLRAPNTKFKFILRKYASTAYSEVARTVVKLAGERDFNK